MFAQNFSISLWEKFGVPITGTVAGLARGAVGYRIWTLGGPWGVPGGPWGTLGGPWGDPGGPWWVPGGSLGDPWSPIGSQARSGDLVSEDVCIFTARSAFLELAMAATGETGETGEAEVVPKTVSQTPHPTHAGGQDDGSYTNSLKLSSWPPARVEGGFGPAVAPPISGGIYGIAGIAGIPGRIPRPSFML